MNTEGTSITISLLILVITRPLGTSSSIKETNIVTLQLLFTSSKTLPVVAVTFPIIGPTLTLTLGMHLSSQPQKDRICPDVGFMKLCLCEVDSEVKVFSIVVSWVRRESTEERSDSAAPIFIVLVVVVLVVVLVGGEGWEGGTGWVLFGLFVGC